MGAVEGGGGAAGEGGQGVGGREEEGGAEAVIGVGLGGGGHCCCGGLGFVAVLGANSMKRGTSAEIDAFYVEVAEYIFGTYITVFTDSVLIITKS